MKCIKTTICCKPLNELPVLAKLVGQVRPNISQPLLSITVSETVSGWAIASGNCKWFGNRKIARKSVNRAEIGQSRGNRTIARKSDNRAEIGQSRGNRTIARKSDNRAEIRQSRGNSPKKQLNVLFIWLNSYL
jgi:hypothetical protein